MKDRSRVAALRNMLREMEVDLGLETLSQHQRDVYYAACLVADEYQAVQSDKVKQHPLLSDMARPTFYRALSELVARGFLQADGIRKDGRYRVKI